MSNFRFLPQIFRGVFCSPWAKYPPKWLVRANCGGHSCRRSVQERVHVLSHGPSTGSCSKCCLNLHPHRASSAIFALLWQNSFVQILGGTALFEAEFGTTPPKRPQNNQNEGVGSSCCKINTHWETNPFPRVPELGQITCTTDSK